MTNLEAFCLIGGFLGMLFGGAFFLAQIDRQSARRGLYMFLICAPVWYFTYDRLSSRYESVPTHYAEDTSDDETKRDLH